VIALPCTDGARRTIDTCTPREAAASAAASDLRGKLGLGGSSWSAAERQYSDSMLPVEALRAWMLLSAVPASCGHASMRLIRLVDYIAAKQIIAPALNAMVGGASKLKEGSRAQIQGAIEALVKRAIDSGDIRKDLDAFDLLRALIGVSNLVSSPDWQQRARRLVDILINASRPTEQ
jgi:hypothetical protein